MQLFLKKLVTLNILLIFFCNQTIFGMILNESHIKSFNAIKKKNSLPHSNQILHSDTTILNNIFVHVACNSDGKIKNILRSVNKEFANKFSIKNDYFLLVLNKGLIAEIDVQKILLQALWRDEKEIVEVYKSLYNSNEKISLKNIFGTSLLPTLNNWCVNEKLCYCEPKKFKVIKKTKQLLFNNEILDTQKDMWQALQLAALCDDRESVQKLSQMISATTDYTILLPMVETLLLWLMLMYLNKKEMFRLIVNADPLKIIIHDKKALSFLIGFVKSEEINVVNKNEYMQILKAAAKKVHTSF